MFVCIYVCVYLGIQEVVPQGIQEVVPQGIQEVVPLGVQEVVPPGIQEVVPQGIQEVVPQGIQEVVPQGIQEVVSEGIQEVVPQGIQGSAVFIRHLADFCEISINSVLNMFTLLTFTQPVNTVLHYVYLQEWIFSYISDLHCPFTM